MSAAKRIVILGGGFGGVYAAMRLERLLRRRDDIEITLVNRDNFFLFTPMLHEVAASDLDPTHIVNPLRKLLNLTKVHVGEVESIDLSGRRVKVSHGFARHEHPIEFDYLLLTLGSTTNFFGLPGAEENSITMKSLGDAILLRNRLIAHLEEADTECAQKECGDLMTFVVAGGGFSGIETIGAVNDFIRDSLRFYPRIDPSLVRMVVVHGGPVVLPELGEELGRYAQEKLSARDVEIRTNARVARATHDSVVLSDGTRIGCRTLIWTAGTTPHSILGTLPCQREHGRLRVNEFLEIPDHPGVWALGDCAYVPNPRTGKAHPPTAQHAIREARTAAWNVAAAILGNAKRPFEFTTIGQLAAIGHRTGVAKILRFKFSGFFAWWLWRTIYLAKLPRLEKKIRVALDWTLDLIFSKDLVQYVSVRAQTMSQALHEQDHDHTAPVNPESSPATAPAIASDAPAGPESSPESTPANA